MKELGFKGGRVLEPSMGTGHFLGLAPSEAETLFYGVELNRMVGEIAQHLYPEALISIKDFKDFNLPEGEKMDWVIGNPPYGASKIYDASNPRLSGLSVHHYFMAKSIDALEEGGILMMVVTSNFMDAKDPQTRGYIAERADLLAAVRLPNGVFKSNANTEVLTDVLVFQKRADGEQDNGIDFTDTTLWGSENRR